MQKIAGHILILWMALFVIPNHLFASVVNFNGEVVDEKGLPLPSVVVFVEGTTHGAFTDGNGYFSFDYELGSSEKICLRFSIVGFQEEVRCVSHGMTSLKVVMKERTEELEQQEVNAIRKQDDYLQRLEMSGMKNIPDAGGGAIESLLATQAGGSMNNELSSQYSVRGGNYDENCVYVNSIEIHRPLLIRSGEQEGLSFVNPNMVESVSFSSGGFGVEYGDRMASVLDIRYKRPSKLEGSAFVSLMGASAYVGQSTGKFSQMHGVRFKKSRLLLSSLDTDADYNPNFLDYQTHVTYDVSEKFRLSFLANISRNDYLYEPHSREASFGTLTDTKNIRIGFVGREQDLFVTYFGSLSLDYNPTEKTKLSLTTSDFHTSENVSYDITSSYWIGNQLTKEYALGTSTTHEHARNDLNATVANLSLLGETKFNFNTIKWGVSYRREIIDEFVNEWEMHDSAGYFIPMNNQFLMMYDNLNSKKKLKTKTKTMMKIKKKKKKRKIKIKKKMKIKMKRKIKVKMKVKLKKKVEIEMKIQMEIKAKIKKKRKKRKKKKKKKMRWGKKKQLKIEKKLKNQIQTKQKMKKNVL